MIKKVRPITKKSYSSLDKIMAKKLSNDIQSIDNRVEYIVRSICTVFDVQFSYWNYYDTDFETSLDVAIKQIMTEIVIIDDGSARIANLSKDFVVIIGKDEEWGLGEGFPERWLYEDFEEELADGKTRYEEKIAKIASRKIENSIKVKTYKENNNKLLASLLAKSTPDEAKVLKRKWKLEKFRK